MTDGGNNNGQGWSGTHGNIQATGQVTLTGGQYYPITIGYAEGGGGFGLEAFYATPGNAIANGDFLPLSVLGQLASSSIGDLSGQGTLAIAGTLTENASTAGSQFDGTLAGNGVFVKSGAGTLTLTNPTNSYTGTVRLGQGVLALTSSSVLQTATLDLEPGDAGTLGTSGIPALNLGGLMGSNNFVAFSPNAGPLNIGYNGVNTTYSGNLSGVTILSKYGTGNSTLSGINNITQGVAVNDGSLEVTTTAALSVAPSAVSVASGASLIVQPGNGINGWSSAQIVSLASGATWTSGSNGPATLGIDTVNGNATVSGIPAVPLALNVLGGNTLTLTGTNSHTGPTTVSAGALTVATNSALVASPLTVASGATANFVSSSPAIVGLSGAGSVSLGNVATSGATALTVNNAANNTFTGVISEAATGLGSLAKGGSGTLTLTSASNTYSGGTTINQGTLSALPGGLGSGAITLAGGAFQPVPLTPGLAAQYYYTYTPLSQANNAGGPNGWSHLNTTSLAGFSGPGGYLASNGSTPWATNLSNLGLPQSTTLSANGANNIVADVAAGAKGSFNFDSSGEGQNFPYPYNQGSSVYWAASYTGYFYAATTGVYTFATNSDDDSRIWIGSSDAAVVANGNNGQGWAGYGIVQNTTGTVSLMGGQYYPITIGYDEGNGGYGLEAFVATPGNTLTVGQAGTFLPLSMLSTANSVYTNPLVVTQNSAISLRSDIAVVSQFPSLTIGTNTLSVTGGVTGSGVTISGPTTLNGTATFNLGSSVVMTLAGSVSGTGGLTESGNGTLILGSSSGNGYSGPTTVNGGQLVAANGIFSTATGNGVVTLNGGTLASDPNLGGQVGTVVGGSGAHMIAPGGVNYIGILEHRRQPDHERQHDVGLRRAGEQ